MSKAHTTIPNFVFRCIVQLTHGTWKDPQNAQSSCSNFCWEQAWKTYCSPYLQIKKVPCISCRHSRTTFKYSKVLGMSVLLWKYKFGRPNYLQLCRGKLQKLCRLLSSCRENQWLCRAYISLHTTKHSLSARRRVIYFVVVGPQSLCKRVTWHRPAICAGRFLSRTTITSVDHSQHRRNLDDFIPLIGSKERSGRYSYNFTVHASDYTVRRTSIVLSSQMVRTNNFLDIVIFTKD